MATIENIGVWNKAIELAKDTYVLCKNNKDICNDFGLRSQMQRASVSIASNIAEGADRGSKKEFIRFLHIARGSCSELKTQLNIIKVLKYIENKEFNDIINKLIEVHKMLNGFIKTIEKQIEQKKL